MNTTEPNEIVSRHLFAKLAETAEKLRREQTATDAEIVKCFASVAVTIACNSIGPAMAAEYLRDIADTVERDLCGL